MLSGVGRVYFALPALGMKANLSLMQGEVSLPMDGLEVPANPHDPVIQSPAPRSHL